MVGPIASGPALPASDAYPAAIRTSESPGRMRDAARQFESLLLGQILKSARQAGGGGWMDDGSDQAGSVATDMAEEQFAQALAQNGGLGLTDLIVSGLSKR